MGSGGVAIAALPTVICLKVPFSDGLGGGKNNLAHQTLPCTQISQSDHVPSIPKDTKISAITFRNKYNGWKSYQMEIRFK